MISHQGRALVLRPAWSPTRHSPQINFAHALAEGPRSFILHAAPLQSALPTSTLLTFRTHEITSVWSVLSRMALKFGIVAVLIVFIGSDGLRAALCTMTVGVQHHSQDGA